MDFKKVWPHAVAIATFFIIVFIYFIPLFQGEQVDGHDNDTWLGGAKEINDFREANGTEPLWTNRMFSGMPAYQISMESKNNLLLYVYKGLLKICPFPAFFIFAGLISFYVLLITLKFDYRLAIAGGISFAMCSFNFYIIQAGHNSQALAIALMPLVVAGILQTFRGNYLLGAGLTAFGMAFEIMANHVQISYYLGLMLMVFFISELYFATKNKTMVKYFTACAIIGVASLIGVMSNSTSLLTTYEYGKDSTRGKSELTKVNAPASSGLDIDYAFQWCYGKAETFNLLVPNILGGPSQSDIGTNSKTYDYIAKNFGADQALSFSQKAPAYWGDQPSVNGADYMGAMAIFFFAVGMFLVQGRKKWWLFAATILSFVLSWGKNFMAFNEFWYNNFPLYNKFRSVSFILIIASFTIPFLSMLTLKKLFDAKVALAEKQKALMRGLYVVGGLLVLILIGSAGFSYSGPVDTNFAQNPDLLVALKADRAKLLRMDTLRSLFFVLLAFGAIWFYLKKKLDMKYVLIALPILFLIDMWPISKRYLNDSHFKPKQQTDNPFTKSAADEQILQDKELGYRVINTTVSTFNDASTSYYHNSIGGYHGAKLERYQELIENHISKNNMSVLNMLNTKYFIVSPKEGQSPMAQMNPEHCGSAWFVPEFKIVANADEESKSLEKFNPRVTAFIDQRFKDKIGNFKINYDSVATIQLTKYDANYLVYKSKCATDQLCVMSEIYYEKGWNAYVDGKLTPHWRCNYVLRSMIVPAGNHTIEFKFEPVIYKTGETISLASSSIMLLLFFGALIIPFFRKQKSA